MQSNEINGNNASLVANRAEIAGAIKADAVAKLNLPNDPAPPLDVLPLFARTLVVEAETALGIHPSFSLGSMIMAVATSIGATHRVQIKPGSLHSACLYMALIGRPNVNKSGGLKFSFSRIKEHDKFKDTEFEQLKKRYDALKDSQGQKPSNEMEESDKQLFGKDLSKVPVKTKTLLVDYTREALIKTHKNNLRGVTVFRDELIGLFKDMNRFSSGGDIEFLLSNWSHSLIDTNRVTTESITIHNPVISIVGTIQPGPLKSLANGKEDNGLMDRFLFAWPDIQEKTLWTDNQIPQQLIDKYNTAIDRLLDLKFNTVDDELGEGWKNEPHVLKLSDSAKIRLFKYFNIHNKNLCDSAENDRLRGMHGKMELQVIRLALVLQMLWYGYDEAGKESISDQTVERAIKLGEWFRSQSLKVYKYLHESGPLEELDQEEQRLYESLGSSFTTSEAKKTSAEKLKWSEKKAQRFLKRCTDLQVTTKESRGTYSKLF